MGDNFLVSGRPLNGGSKVLIFGGRRRGDSNESRGEKRKKVLSVSAPSGTIPSMCLDHWDGKDTCADFGPILCMNVLFFPPNHDRIPLGSAYI